MIIGLGSMVLGFRVWGIIKLYEPPKTLLGGSCSWVVISRVISRVTIAITHTWGLTAAVIATHKLGGSKNPFY